MAWTESLATTGKLYIFHWFWIWDHFIVIGKRSIQRTWGSERGQRGIFGWGETTGGRGLSWAKQEEEREWAVHWEERERWHNATDASKMIKFWAILKNYGRQFLLQIKYNHSFIGLIRNFAHEPTDPINIAPKAQLTKIERSTFMSLPIWSQDIFQLSKKRDIEFHKSDNKSLMSVPVG